MAISEICPSSRRHRPQQRESEEELPHDLPLTEKQLKYENKKQNAFRFHLSTSQAGLQPVEFIFLSTIFFSFRAMKRSPRSPPIAFASHVPLNPESQSRKHPTQPKHPTC